MVGINTPPVGQPKKRNKYRWATIRLHLALGREGNGERGVRYTRGTMELGEVAEGWVLPGVHTLFSHKERYLYQPSRKRTPLLAKHFARTAQFRNPSKNIATLKDSNQRFSLSEIERHKKTVLNMTKRISLDVQNDCSAFQGARPRIR